ncbi:putative amidoligase domain-containing protein [Paenibacillus apiarius]|uniref:PhiEco32-like amidoligase-type 2 protein n=1 Tax=Paenibacillus apiarius TaxID=46240 RepID=A0ABT4DTY8_9BACL|nr:hypothetical protein [Paenibacillus apiarius]MCY9515879.1 hypothetical protein [Paenibacillus apiarius]MCY9520789.1 hypothetical protein [Paenibacillus apiarius]MCY9553493.1 hypothetical protein [Paenibacillus apiarius]MCY9557983.1 hypothetical protein [Paenibacillus apiarius]MCY9685838.1 hypothetical protein [Paenibacillus apiarius]
MKAEAIPHSIQLLTDDNRVCQMWNGTGIPAALHGQFKELAESGHGGIGEDCLVVLWMRHAHKQVVLQELAKRAVRLGKQHGIIVLNRFAQAWNHRTMRLRLRSWGLPVAEKAAWSAPYPIQNSRRFVRTLCFWVNQCEVVAAAHCMRTPQGGYGYLPADDWSQPPYRRLGRLAVRAAYALGWDTAAITLRYHSADSGAHAEWPAGMADEPQAGDVIERVEPAPRRLPEWVMSRYISAWSKTLAETERSRKEPKRTLKLGLDMELILYHPERRKIVPAIRYLPRGGVAGCDAVRIQGKIRYPLVELRPAPAAAPAQLLRHLRAAMARAARLIREKDADGAALKWLAGSQPLGSFALGGHIHVSGIALTSDLVRMLDTYVALPLALIEDPHGAVRRRPKYGTFGDVRLQEHGGDGGFEYRTLPSFLESPQLALEVLSLFHSVIVHGAMLARRDSVRTEVVRRYYRGGEGETVTELRPLALALLQEVLDALDSGMGGGMEGDSRLVRADILAIRSLYARIDTGWRWNENEDIRAAWLHDAMANRMEAEHLNMYEY